MTKSDKMKLAWAKRKADPNYKSRKKTTEEKREQTERMNKLWEERRANPEEYERIKENMTNAQRERHESGVGSNISPEQLAKRNKRIGDVHRGKDVSIETRQKLSEVQLGRKHTEEHRRKNSEAQKGKKKHTEEFKQKMSKFKSEFRYSEESKRKISASLTGKIMSKETKLKISKGNTGLVRSEEARLNVSRGVAKYRRETGGHSYGIFGKREDLNNQYFRSRWEANYARYLNSAGIAWKFEPKSFDTPYGTYIPDFYLSQFDVYVEVKSWEKKPSQFSKRGWLRENNVIILIEVWGDTYNNLCRIYQDVLEYWET